MRNAARDLQDTSSSLGDIVFAFASLVMDATEWQFMPVHRATPTFAVHKFSYGVHGR
ncbi:MAG: hypothetical protein ACI9DC_003609 [Gammaproteobacteria bacterium]|jgi:hypothetical protein